MRSSLEELMRQADPAELYEMPPVTGDRDDPLYASILSRRGVTMAGQTTDHITGPADRIRPWRRAPAITFAATFAAVLVVGTVTLFWLTRSGSPEVVDEPTTTTLVTTTTTLPPAIVAPMVESWQRVGAEAMAPAWAIFDMTDTPSGFVAIGFDLSAGDSAEGLVFSSPDGVTWSRLAEDDPALTDGTVFIYGLTEGGPGLVGVGISCQDAVKPCTVRPTVWTSVDGASWMRSDADPVVFTQSGAMLDADAIDVGVIAVGNIDEISPDGTVGARPAAWFSEDGFEWSRVFDGDWVDNADVGVAGFHAVERTPDGLVVGVGSAENQAGDAVAAVWVSPDGESWERVARETFASGTAIVDVAWGPRGLVAVGGIDGSEAAIWQSPDGYSWSRVDTAGQPFEATGEVSTIAALEDGYVAGGPGLGDQQGGPVTLWTSPDGLNWDRVQTIAAGNARAIVVADTGIAVGGAAYDTDGDHAAVWVGPVFDPSAPPPDPQPPTTAEVPEALPVPGPGMEWERIESEALDPGFIWAVTSSDDLIVAVGEVQYFVDVDPAFGETPNGVVWASADGVEWTRIDDPGIFGGDGPQIISDVVAGPSGFIASGDDGANSVLWFSADGYTWQRVFEDMAGLVVASDGPGWIAAEIEEDALTGVYFTSADGINWMTVSDPEEAAALDTELRLLSDKWHSPYAPPALTGQRLPATAVPSDPGTGVWAYAWNGDQVMAVVRDNFPAIWVSPDAGTTWYRVDHEQPAFDGPYPATQTLDVEFFDGKYVVVGFASESAAVWQGTWSEPQGS